MERIFQRYRIDVLTDSGEWETVWDDMGWDAQEVVRHYIRHIASHPAYRWQLSRKIRAIPDNSRPLFGTI